MTEIKAKRKMTKRFVQKDFVQKDSLSCKLGYKAHFVECDASDICWENVGKEIPVKILKSECEWHSYPAATVTTNGKVDRDGVGIVKQIFVCTGKVYEGHVTKLKGYYELGLLVKECVWQPYARTYEGGEFVPCLKKDKSFTANVRWGDLD